MRKTRLERWESKVDATGDCWIWTASRTVSGYGMFTWSGTTRTTAHRAAYRMFVGKIPDGYEVDHICRTRACVRPGHLRAVTVQENRRTRHHANQHTKQTHCKRGHPLEGPNLVPNKKGQRICRECSRAKGREWVWRHRGRGRFGGEYVDEPKKVGRPRV